MNDYIPNRSTARRVNRAEAYMNKLVDKKVLTPEGMAFLMQALDPFHDVPKAPARYPDGYNGVSNALIIPLQVDIKKPVAVVAPWTCHIFSLPVATNFPISPLGIISPPVANLQYLPAVNADATTFAMNMFNVHAGTDGSNLGNFSLSVNSFVGDRGLTSATIPSGFRVVSLGYEVHNTTAPLNLQGMSTHYRMVETPQGDTMNIVNGITGANLNSGTKAVQFQTIPATASQALSYPGTQRWEARFGNYTVVPMTTVVNPPRVFVNKGVYFWDANTAPVGRYMTENLLAAPYVVPAGVGFQDKAFIPYQTCGSFYTGLSDSTTLTLNIRIGLERMPNIQVTAEADMVRMSCPTPPRDPFALAVYSEALRELPVSVFVSENSFGDWFMSVANKVLNTALPILSMIPHPVAQALKTIALPLEEATRPQQKQLKQAPKASPIQPNPLLLQVAPATTIPTQRTPGKSNNGKNGKQPRSKKTAT